MAQAPTLCQFELALNHVDRGVEAALSLRTARHPSETMQRVWLRVLAYCWHYEERLVFGPGLSDPDAPDLLTLDFGGEMTRWVRVGKADPAKVQRVANQNGRAAVAVFFESPARLAAFRAEGAELTGLARVELVALDAALVPQLGEERRNRASITIVGEHFYIERDGVSIDGGLTR